MANVSIAITRDNGTTVTGSATVDDTLLVDLTSMLGSLIFDSLSSSSSSSSSTTAEEPSA